MSNIIINVYFSFRFYCVLFKKISFIYLFLERGRKGEREGEKHQCVVASHAPPTGDLACNPGMCPDWELNWRPFDSQAGTQSTEPHQPGQFCWFLKLWRYMYTSLGLCVNIIMAFHELSYLLVESP